MKSFEFSASALFNGVVEENCREIRERADQELSDFIDDMQPVVRGESYC